jgi:hypothetical protein
MVTASVAVLVAAITTAAPAPLHVGPLQPGRYQTAVLSPRLTFTLGPGWRDATPAAEERDNLTLTRTGGLRPQAISILWVSSIFSPRDPTTTIAVPRKPELLLRSDRRVHVLAQQTTTIGGRPATVVDFVVVRGDVSCPASIACMTYAPAASQALDAWVVGQRVRLAFIHVGRRILAVAVESPRTRYPAFAPIAKRVVASIRIG